MSGLRRPIRLAWFSFVLPALVLNYFGQGALLLDHPEAIDNPFFKLTPEPLLYPMIGLATVATVIASQAVISGAFSMTREAMSLGYSMRMPVVHTSREMSGQIFVPWVNNFLLIMVLAAVLGFRSSDNLSAAYGIAVTKQQLLRVHRPRGIHTKLQTFSFPRFQLRRDASIQMPAKIALIRNSRCIARHRCLRGPADRRSAFRTALSAAH